MEFFDLITVIGSTTLRMSIPLLLAALGGMYSAKVGIMALGLEGMMLAGAFGATAGAFYFGDPYIGLLFAILSGLLIALLHGILTIRYHVNHIISGVGLNFLSIGITTLLLQEFWGSRGNSPQTASFEPLFGSGALMNLITPIAIIAVIVLIGSVYLFKRTILGFHLTSVGENPYAAATAGIPVNTYKYLGVAVCGILAGVSGAFLSIDHLDLFVREMTAGRGYIAVVINILGNYSPLGILFSSLIFGLAEAVQINLQGYGVPSQFIQMIPYLITLLVLVVAVRNIRAPKYVGRHFVDTK